jgi:hypothetical protein
MNQSKEILDYLKGGNTLTPIEALERFKCFRLAARINDLRDAGYLIKTIKQKTPSGKSIACYKYLG